MLELGFENVAEGKRAWQSSLSQWSKPNDAERALDDDGKRDFAFHTDIEDNPWWMVDLGDQYPIHHIVICNRRKIEQQKARTLTVEVSRDGENWIKVHAGKEVFFDLNLSLHGEMLARFLRISLRERRHLHLSKVEVWTKRSLLKIKENRYDGFGCRLQALLNTVYLSKALNCDFRVVWPDSIGGLGASFANDVKVSDRTVFGHSIESASEVFREHFVERYVENGRPAVTSKISSATNLTPADLHSPKYHDRFGVIYAPMHGISEILPANLAPDQAFGLPEIFFSIPFSDKIQGAIDSALAVPLTERAAAVHLRSGDIVFGTYRTHGRRFLRKAVSLPVAKLTIETLQKQGYDVVVFGEDTRSLEYLRDTYGVTLASQFHTPEMGGAVRAMFDITLLSRANKIWAGFSGFAQIAGDISRTAEFTDIHDAIDSATVRAYMARDLQEHGDDYHPLQTAFALWTLFCLSASQPIEERTSLLDRAFSLDPTNASYLIAKASAQYEAGRDQEGSATLKSALLDSWEHGAKWGGTAASKMLCANHLGKFHLHHFLPPLIEASKRKQMPAVMAAIMIAEAKGDHVASKRGRADLRALDPSNALLKEVGSLVA